MRDHHTGNLILNLWEGRSFFVLFLQFLFNFDIVSKLKYIVVDDVSTTTERKREFSSGNISAPVYLRTLSHYRWKWGRTRHTLKACFMHPSTGWPCSPNLHLPKQRREWMGPTHCERSVLTLGTCLLPASLVCEALQKLNLAGLPGAKKHVPATRMGAGGWVGGVTFPPKFQWVSRNFLLAMAEPIPVSGVKLGGVETSDWAGWVMCRVGTGINLSQPRWAKPCTPWELAGREKGIGVL